MKIKLCVVAVWLIAGIMTLPAVSQAIPGGPWASQSSPLINKYNERKTGAGYGVWEGYREDQGRGSRVQDQSYHRMPEDDPYTNNRGTYVKTKFWTNGAYCYVASYSDSGGSVACTSGWNASDTEETGRTRSTAWAAWEVWDPADPTANSGRGQMWVCLDIVNWPNNCSTGYFLRGSKYN